MIAYCRRIFLLLFAFSFFRFPSVRVRTLRLRWLALRFIARLVPRRFGMLWF